MSKALRVILATSDALRHRYAAATLSATADVVGVVSEPKMPAASSGEQQEARAVVLRHLADRAEAERRLLGTTVAFPEVELLSLSACGEINSPGVVRWIEQRRPDVVVLFGTSIIKPPLLDLYPGRLVNVHLGLSPYYRGSGTNFWPLVHRRPECVGATIHLAVARVDAGAILAQLRPEAELMDRAHDLGTKTIVAAFQALPCVLMDYVKGKVEPRGQHLEAGRVFRRSDFNATAVGQMWHHFATGMMAEYVQDAERRRAAYPIVALTN